MILSRLRVALFFVGVHLAYIDTCHDHPHICHGDIKEGDMFAEKAVKRDRSTRTEARGLDRFYIDLSAQYKAGLVPSRFVRKDDGGNPFETETAAVAFARKIEKSIHEGGTTGDREKTFGDAVEAWVSWKRLSLARAKVGRKNATGEKNCNEAIAHVRNHIIGKWTLRDVAIERVRLSTITYALLDDELFGKGQALELGLAREGVVKLLQKFRQIFEVAVDQRYIATSPAQKILLGKKQRRAPTAAIDPDVYGRFRDDIPAILNALEIIDQDSVLPVEVLLETGIRGGELDALTLDQIKITNLKTKVRIDSAWKTDGFVGTTKSTLARDVVADIELGSALTARAVQHQRRGKDFIFGDDGVTPLNRTGLRRDFHQAQFAIRGWGFFGSSSTRTTARGYRLVQLPKRITEFTSEEWKKFAYGQAGLPKGEEREGICFPTIEAAAAHIRLNVFGLHKLRHLYASQLLDSGVPLKRVAQRLGDLETTVEGHYKHYLPEDDDADLEDIAAIAAIGRRGGTPI